MGESEIKQVCYIGFGEFNLGMIVERSRLVLIASNHQITNDLVTEEHGLGTKNELAFAFLLSLGLSIIINVAELIVGSCDISCSLEFANFRTAVSVCRVASQSSPC